MKVAILVFCLLAILPLITAHKWRGGDRGHHKWNGSNGDKENNGHKWKGTPYTCKAKTDNGKYCLGRLYQSEGDAYTTIDSYDDTFYFNFCGDLSGTTASDGSTASCDPTAAACVKTSSGTYVNVGRPSDDSFSVSTPYTILANGTETPVPSQIILTYTNGDLCESTSGNYETIITLTCDDSSDDDTLNVTNSNFNATTCQATIEASSRFACPRRWGRRGAHGGVSFLAFLLPCLCCCSLCVCIAACCRRRRRMMMMQRHQQQQQQRTLEMNTYTAVPQEAPQQQPQQQQSSPQMQFPQPYILPTQFQPQYFQPSPYYMYVPQYTQPMAPAAPVVPLEENHIEHREVQVDQDEKLARELQAKFDNE